MPSRIIDLVVFFEKRKCGTRECGVSRKQSKIVLLDADKSMRCKVMHLFLANENVVRREKALVHSG
jgi:hypothetical protein